jgi:hypothetical protein
MRFLTSLRDIELGVGLTRPYDVALFASGYESRASALPRRFSRERIFRPVILGFRENSDNPVRQLNDRYFKEAWQADPVNLSSGEPGAVAKILEQNVNSSSEEARVLIDISSMSRGWYADAINWARFSQGPQRIVLDFIYQSGIYPGAYPHRTVSETTTLSGFEGQSDVRLQTVALLGLGYDPITPHAILEDLQPDLKYAFVAGGSSASALALALDLNRATIEELDGNVVVIPLMSIQDSYRALAEMSLPHSGIRNVVIVTLGPKTHTLASLLLASHHEEITCLHVKGSSSELMDVLPADGVSLCSVVFDQKSQP